MTTPDELQRAVERLKKAVVFAEGASLVDHEDIDFLLSERAELLATVERMRGALKRARRYVADLPIVGDADLAVIDAAILKATTPNAGEKG